MKDFLGRELEIDDEVVVMAKNYRSLVKAHIIKFTPKQVRVVYMNTWNYGKPGREEEYLTWPSEIVKVT